MGRRVRLSLTAPSTAPKPSKDDDCPEVPWIAVTRLGDIWICGSHRLACGDAKDPNVVATVMGGVMADMSISDLPFNVRIDGHVSGKGRVKHREFAEASGEMSPEEFTAFLTASFEAIEGVCRNGAIVYTFMDWRHLAEILTAGKAVFNELKNLCVWNKTNAGMGTFYRSQHELILVWKVGDAPHTNNFGSVNRRRGLLTPRLVQSTCVDRIETDLVEELYQLGLLGVVVTGDGECDAAGGATWLPSFEQAAPREVVDRLQNRATEMTRGPLAFCRTFLDGVDPALPLTRIVVPGIHHDHFGTYSFEKIGWQVRDPAHGIATKTMSPLSAASLTVTGTRRFPRQFPPKNRVRVSWLSILCGRAWGDDVQVIPQCRLSR